MIQRYSIFFSKKNFVHFEFFFMLQKEFAISIDVMTKKNENDEKTNNKNAFNDNKINAKNLLNRFFQKNVEKRIFKVNINHQKTNYMK